VTPARRALLDWIDAERRLLLAALEAELDAPGPVEDHREAFHRRYTLTERTAAA
jgi:hypothetical protein